MRNRPPVAGDNIGKPCRCLECQAAGVTEKPIVRVPADDTCSTSHWLHGEPLKRWHERRAQFMQQARSAVGPRGRHANGFERLANAPDTSLGEGAK